MFWYLATPYSNYTQGVSAAFRDASRQAAMFIRAKIPIFCPIAHTHPIAVCGKLDTRDLSIWLPADKAFMEASCGIIVCMLDGWEDSKGIQYEIEFFKKSGKPIVYMTPGVLPSLPG